MTSFDCFFLLQIFGFNQVNKAINKYTNAKQPKQFYLKLLRKNLYFLSFDRLQYVSVYSERMRKCEMLGEVLKKLIQYELSYHTDRTIICRLEKNFAAF